MNFFTKHWKTEEVMGIACGVYAPNVFHNEDEPFIVLDFLKLKPTKKLLDPIFLTSAIFIQPGCLEGFLLIKDKLEIYLKQINKIPEDFVLDAYSQESRIELFYRLAQDPLFIRTELRLKLIELIEELE